MMRTTLLLLGLVCLTAQVRASEWSWTAGIKWDPKCEMQAWGDKMFKVRICSGTRVDNHRSPQRNPMTREGRHNILDFP